MSSMKRFFVVLLSTMHIAAVFAVKPPNYIDKPKVPDKYPPKYEYNYFVANQHTQAAQGHKEIRNGDYTRGNYFVNLPKGESKTTVNYIADEWGFFPVTRYLNRGPHHRVSGHFALGQHAVERLNETNLNTNEVFINQSPDYQHAPLQQQAQATFPTAQVVYSPKTVDNKPQSSGVYAPNQPHHEHQQQQIVFQSPGALYSQQIPQLRSQEKHPAPLLYQQVPPMPLIYQYAQQPQFNYFYQPKPQEVIYHQQPIASMAPLQQKTNEQQEQIVFVESEQPQPEAVASNNGNVNGEEISLPHVDDGVNGNSVQVQPNNVDAEIQRQAAQGKDIGDENLFESPIIVGEQQANFPLKSENETVVVQQKPNQGPVIFQAYQQPQKQFNIQILTEASHSNVQVSDAPKIVNGHTNSNNFQYLVDDDQDRLDSTPGSVTEAPSRQFLKKFKNFRTYEQSTTSQSFVTSTTKSITKVTSDGGCCKDKESTNCCKGKTEEKVLEITQRPIPNTFLAPVHAGVRLNNVKVDDCVDEKSVVEVHKTVNVVVEEPKSQTYGERIVVSSTPPPRFVTKPIFVEKSPIVVEKQHHTEVIHPPVVIEKSVIQEIHVPVEKPVYIKTPPRIVDRPVYIKSPPETKFVEKIVHQPVDRVVEKIVDRPYYIKSPPETKVVQQQVFVEKPVIKEVQVPVEKTVFVPSPPETKIVHQPVIQTVEKPVYIEKIVQQPVERIVEKIVDRPVIQTVEKPVYIEKIVDRPVERIVEKPLLQTVERIVDRPVAVEKYIDRPYPVPYAVGIPFEKHVYLKPDFHVVAKPIAHKLFDFEGLFGFLSKKKEVKHIYVPASHQHQLKNLNHHQLIQSTLTTIDPVRESPVLDYTRYATTHLNPIKPVYGAPLAPINTGYNYPNPYAGNFAYDQINNAGAQTIPSSWIHDNVEAQQAQISSFHLPPTQRDNVEAQQAQISSFHLPPTQRDNVEAQQAQISSFHLPPVHRDNYIGPTPQSDDYWAINTVSTKEGIKFRRNVENGRSFRIEYGGFHPKMSPSVEIDENGKPLKKEDN